MARISNPKGAKIVSVTRVLLKQGGKTYRFLKFEPSADGSLLAFSDRDPRPQNGSMSMAEDGTFVVDEVKADKTVSSAKFSIHTTGEVRHYAGGQHKRTIYIEPLHGLTKLGSVGFVSIPRVALLDEFDEAKHQSDTMPILEIPDGVSERMTFGIEIGPTPQRPATEGVALNYELYSAVVRLIPSPALAPEMANHFVHGIPLKGQFDKRQTDKATAEIAFHQRIHGQGLLIFREDSGAYVVLTMVPMHRTPELKMTFGREDLRVELIPYNQGTEPSHKVRFWICDKGGRSKSQDLRNHIKSVELNARL
jgi:hypothetical protein